MWGIAANVSWLQLANIATSVSLDFASNDGLSAALVSNGYGLSIDNWTCPPFEF